VAQIIEMRVTWTRCPRYKDAKALPRGVVYLHEENGQPFRWGMANSCRFTDRYNVGYEHWITGCLLQRGKLYIGCPDSRRPGIVRDVERTLILAFRPASGLNRKAPKPKNEMVLTHVGMHGIQENIPRCLR